MKANQKFLRGDDEAVSPVIAVILMVAITVVLAATVYVWVSGFGSQSSNPAKTMSLTSASALASDAGSNNWKNYTVSAASSGLRYGDLKFTLDGAELACATTATADRYAVSQAGAAIACDSTKVIGAGDRIEFLDFGGGMAGKTLRILDSQANSVILTLVVG